MKLTHKQKVKMARKMLTPFERKMGTPIFESRAWERRKVENLAKTRKEHLNGKNQREVVTGK